ncbi:MAG TPA: sugar phosphate isomerase/epimerase, partial [Pseudothermotoga sp.]|nr:sugar phosphate isomerase/epimerase [Pseudothermotoga sp.]
DGVVSVELFNGKYWEMDPKRIARESYEKLSDVLNI